MTPAQEKHLTQQLDDAGVAIEQLLTILKSEQRALAEHDVELLENTANEKQLCLSGLAMVESRLGETFKALGFDIQKGVLGQLGKLAHENVSLRSRVELMRQQLQECSQLTNENSVLITAGINNVRSSLDLIRGGYEEGFASLYGPSGHTTDQDFKRYIATV